MVGLRLRRIGLLMELGRRVNGQVVEWLVFGDGWQNLVWRDLDLWC